MSVTTLFGRPTTFSFQPADSFQTAEPRNAPDASNPTDASNPAPRADPSFGGTNYLSDIVRRVAGTPSLWRRYARLQGSDRAWTRIEVPEDVDVWVIVWGTSARTELHDHGDAEAAFTTVRGRLTEIRPDRDGRLIPRRFAPGVIATVEVGQVHDVTNEFAEPAVSIHAYAPRLRQMTFYTRSVDGLFVPDRVSDTTLPEV